ncbi:MAG: zinc transport system substrate-binding protein [Yoonia sp.]|jgi:zinc transport system substrate-binding protein
MIRSLTVLCLLPLPVLADVPRVVTDIAPIHSLTAQVMGDLGQPDLLLPPGADPHDFALRPSDAGRLADAELLIWVGVGLTPWLEEPLKTLAPDAVWISLLDTSSWDPLELREKVDDDGDNHDHDHGDIDPHAWLDPTVAKAWVAAIADALSNADPENAATYRANATTATAALATLQDEVAATLAGLGNRAYVLPHDGYQYFENRFGLTAQATISGIDARTPGPAQIASLRAQMAKNKVVCVFSDAEIGESWAQVITEGTDAKTVSIDGVGVGLEAGLNLYADTIIRLGNAFVNCLDGGK